MTQLPLHKNKHILVFLICFTFLTSNAQDLVAKDAVLQQISNAFIFTEGPAIAPNGDVYFTDQPNNKILKWEASTNTITTYLENAGRSNGLYFDNNGSLLACADEKFELWQIDANKNHKVLLDAIDTRKMNGPNDLWVTPKGGIYFTDPYYQRPYWTRTEQEMDKNQVYFIHPKTKKVQLAATDFVQPNGIIGSKDGKTLYIADIGANKTYKYTITADGSLTNKTLFTELGSDGMTIDNKGNIYLTGNGVTIFNPQGKQIHHIPIDQEWTANVTFGGLQQNILFITAKSAVYTLEMKVNGIRY